MSAADCGKMCVVRFNSYRFMSGGYLEEQLNEGESFGEKRTTFYAAEITVAIQLLHQSGILHWDLKLENVLTDAAVFHP